LGLQKIIKESKPDRFNFLEGKELVSLVVDTYGIESYDLVLNPETYGIEYCNLVLNPDTYGIEYCDMN